MVTDDNKTKSTTSLLHDKSGLMSSDDILRAIENCEMVITPFDENANDKRLTPSGFNFSFSRFIISLNKRRFYEIYEDIKKNALYFLIEPGDTALTLTRESLWVSNGIGGTFHSKVTYVAKGLGSVSTTLDPGWQGQLLISINNPNKKPIRIDIGKRQADNIIYETFITLYLYRLATPSTIECSNRDSRLEDINRLLQSNKKSKTQQRVMQILSDMLAYNAERINPNLNKSNNKKDDINAFVISHNEALIEWESKYDELKVVNEKINKQRKLKYYLCLSFVFVSLLLLLLFGVLIFDKESENTKWLLLYIATLIGAPFVGKLFDFLKNNKQG